MPLTIASQRMLAEDRRIQELDGDELSVAIGKVYDAVDAFKAAIRKAAAPTRALTGDIEDELRCLSDVESEVIAALRRYYDHQAVERADDIVLAERGPR